MTKQFTACTHCEVVPSPDELASGAFKRQHSSCPRERANTRKVKLFMRWLESGAVSLEDPGPISSTPAPVAARPPPESEEAERAVRAILPSPVREESSDEDDVDLDRTPRAKKVERLSDTSSESSDDGADEDRDAQPTQAPRQPPAPSSAPRPVSQTVEMVAMQDRVRGLTADLERAREEARANADKARLVHSLHQKAAALETDAARLRQERNAAREELLSVRRELAQANEARAVASQRLREAQGRTNTGRMRTWLMHVPVRRNKFLYHHVSLHKASESFQCLEGDNGTRCHEVELRVYPSGDIEYESIKRKRRDDPDDGQPAPQHPRRE